MTNLVHCTLSGTIVDSRACSAMYPNIIKIINLLLLTLVTARTVERANLSLRFIKHSYSGSMGEDRFNALVLMFVLKDIKLNINKIVNVYAQRHPRRMCFINPLSCDI